MNRVAGFSAALGLLVASVLAGGGPARAAAPAAVVAQIEAGNTAAKAAYEAGDFKKMKSLLAKTAALGEKKGLGGDAAMADTYVLFAILHVEGDEDGAGGVRDFTRALTLRGDVQIPKGMATTPVKAALKKAREAAVPKGAPTVAAAPAQTPAAPPPAKPTVAAVETKPAPDDKALADSKGRLAQLESQLAQVQKEKAERERELADARSKVQKLEQDKAAQDQALAASRTKLAALEQTLAKEKDARDKELAQARSQEQKERDAREKLEQDRQLAEAKARELENKKAQDRREREKLVQGPDLPAKLPEALTCAVPDEAPWRTDLFVHCAARPNLKAKALVFYYRTTGAHYYSLPMERTSKGWYTAMIPADKVAGKVLQYYAQAFDGNESVVATNGKESSPNILSLHAAGPRG
jgi:hypothetical protein